MAGDWIKMRADLFTHPKVFALADRLERDELWTVGALFSFWAWADKHCVDGRVDGATSRLVDRATRVDGLADALVSVGWLVIDSGGISIPEFGEHNGDSAKERSLKNQRQARWRDRKAAGLVDDAPSTAPSTKASTREEKRREEIPTSDEVGKESRKRSAPTPSIAKPDDVDQQTWDDWLTLRKTKKAPVTETVVNGARIESVTAGMTLDAFLQVWCMRGSQGLQADWLKPHERQTASRVQPMSFAQQDEQARRQRWEAMTNRKWPEDNPAPTSFDFEDITPKGIAA